MRRGLVGATAARRVFGRTMTIGKNRGHILELPDSSKAMSPCIRPNLLRVEDVDKEREYGAFVKDLKAAAKFVER